MRKLIIGIVLVIAVIFGWLFFGDDINDVKFKPNRETLNASFAPDRALDAVCYFGWPSMVKILDKSLKINFVIFPGPIKDSQHRNARTFNYMGYFVDTPPDGSKDLSNLFQSINEYKGASAPEELLKYQLLMVKGFPDRLPKVVELLGPWNLLINRSNPTRERLVWKRKMCVGNKLIYGLWMEVIDNKVVKIRDISSQEKINRMI